MEVPACQSWGGWVSTTWKGGSSGSQCTQAEGVKGQTEHNSWLSCATETDSPHDLHAPHDTDIWMWVISYNSSLWPNDTVCFPKVARPRGEGRFSNWWNNPHVHHLVPVALTAIGQAFRDFLIALHSKVYSCLWILQGQSLTLGRSLSSTGCPEKQKVLNICWIEYFPLMKWDLSQKHHVPQNICHHQQ